MKFVRPLLTKGETRDLIDLIEGKEPNDDAKRRLDKARRQLEKALGETPMGWRERSRGA